MCKTLHRHVILCNSVKNKKGSFSLSKYDIESLKGRLGLALLALYDTDCKHYPDIG